MIKAAILANETENDHALWISACKEHSNELSFDVINLTKSDWLERINAEQYDILLAKPPGISSHFKQLYDERIYLLNQVLKFNIYPTLTEIFIYENKRFLYSWLKAAKMPHPTTSIFYDKAEANDFILRARLPLVGKTNIGASGSGIVILNSISACKKYIDRTFSKKGTKRRWGANLSKGNLLRRGLHYLKSPKDIGRKLDLYSKVRSEIHKDFVIFQEYINHDFEWRVVAIGDSYFAHKKLKMGNKASGSLLKNYDNPPLYLFDFAKSIMDKFNFKSQAIDLFETNDGRLLINEMQCIFGQSDPYQMLVDETPGRYCNLNNNWVFEAGDFNRFESYDLRVKHVLQIFNKRKTNTK